MILVTGATGFIGNYVARLLAGRGERLRLLVRPQSDRRPLRDLDAEVIEGDLRDQIALERAVQGCLAVYHVAACYTLWSRSPREIYDINVGGTMALLAAARWAGVERFVYTSTVGTIAPHPDGTPITEATASRSTHVVGHYKRSKLLAERAALSAAADGMPVVIVNPTAPIGARDFKPTPTGKIVKDFLSGRLPAYVSTGLNLVDVHDVARGHLLAAERGVPGERYLLGAENLTMREILQALAAASGRKASRIRIPYAVAWLTGAVSEIGSVLSRQPPSVPLEAVRLAKHQMFADCSKAKHELGYRPGPLAPAIERAVEWFRSQDPDL